MPEMISKVISLHVHKYLRPFGIDEIGSCLKAPPRLWEQQAQQHLSHIEVVSFNQLLECFVLLSMEWVITAYKRVF